MNSMMMARKIRLIMKLRKNGITDSSVLGAIESIPREAFLLPSFHDQAYEDMALPIGQGQTISQPLVVAAMTQSLELNDRHKVLEIGTGSGYQASILSKICRRVYSIERHRPLLKIAEARFQSLNLRNITAKLGDGMKGWKEQAPFDRIIVTAAARGEPPQDLLDQLAVQGIMLIPIVRENNQEYIYKIQKLEDGDFTCEELMPTRFVPLLPEVASSSENISSSSINSGGYSVNANMAGYKREFAYQS